MLVGVSASIVGRRIAALEAFLVGNDDGTGNDGGLLLRSQGHCRALSAGWSGLRALLGRILVNRSNVSGSVRHGNIERRAFEWKNSIFDWVKECSKITRRGNVSCHLLGWFDAMGRGWVCLGMR
jgi:hypothetical protein